MATPTDGSVFKYRRKKKVDTEGGGSVTVSLIPDLSVASTKMEGSDGTALTTGSTTTPVYFDNGVPKAIGYTIAKSVPSDAKFTDTTYKAGDGLSLTEANGEKVFTPNTGFTTTGKNYAVKVDSATKGLYVNVPWTDSDTKYTLASLGGQPKIPATGSAVNPVYFSAEGTVSTCTHSLNKTVPADAVFTDTVYTHPTVSVSRTTSSLNGDSFTCVDSISVNSEGHITGLNVKTVNVPKRGGITVSAVEPTDTDGENGDIWLVY